MLGFKRAKASAGPERSVLFVCLGNICRSPTAEGVFRAAADRAGAGQRIQIDSAGLGDQHIGSPPDPRAIRAAKRRGYDLAGIRGRRITVTDFSRFGWIIAMDEENLRMLTELKPADFSGYLGLLLDFAPEPGTREIPDPYFGGPEGFERVLDLVEASVGGLLERLQDSLGVR